MSHAKGKKKGADEDSDLDNVPQDGSDEASDGGSDEDYDGSDASEVPDVDEARADPLFVSMYNYLLNACREVQSSTNLVVTEAAGEALQEFIWEHLWLARKGFADEDEIDPACAAKPMQ